MSCAACVRRVENALREVPGVTDVAVNLATARATVSHAPGWAGVEALRQVIADQGYEFLGIPDDTREDPIGAAREKEIKDLQTRFAVGIVLSGIIFVGSMQHWFPFLMGIPRQPLLIVLFFLTTPVVFWVGSRFFIGAAQGGPPEDDGHEHAGRRRGACGLALFVARDLLPAVLRRGGDHAPRLLRRRGLHRHPDHPRPAAGGEGERERPPRPSSA